VSQARALTVLGALVAAGTFTPTVAVAGQSLGTIFYSRVAASRQTDGTVWMMAGDGTNDQQVTDGEWPRLSPAKTAVIFLRGRSSPTRGNIVKHVLSGGLESTLFTNSDFVVNFDWTADSATIFFDFECGISKMASDGGNQQINFVQGTDCFDDAPSVRASDGGLVFHNIHAGLFLANADGTGRAQTRSAGAGGVGPAWTPDGHWTSFGHASDTSTTLNVDNYFVRRPNGSARTQIAFGRPAQGDVLGPGRAWPPDGRTLVV